MQKKLNPFTEQQLELLKNNFSTIARKYDVSSSYVSRIAHGQRHVNSDMSKSILSDLTKLSIAFA